MSERFDQKTRIRFRKRQPTETGADTQCNPHRRAFQELGEYRYGDRIGSHTRTRVATHTRTRAPNQIRTRTKDPTRHSAIPTDVRIYRRESSGKQTKIWEGSAPHNIDAWCQSQADTSGCLITMYDAESVKHFHPAKERESD